MKIHYRQECCCSRITFAGQLQNCSSNADPLPSLFPVLSLLLEMRQASGRSRRRGPSKPVRSSIDHLPLASQVIRDSFCCQCTHMIRDSRCTAWLSSVMSADRWHPVAHVGTGLQPERHRKTLLQKNVCTVVRGMGLTSGMM
jgi:hypothetical protein